MGIKSGVAIIVLAVCLMLAGCPGKPAAPRASTSRPSGGQLISFKDVSKIRDAYQKTKALTDEQRQRLEDASLSPHFNVSVYAFLVLIICNEEGNFPRDRLQELFETKASAVEPRDMRLHVKTYRIWAKTPPLGGDLLVDASESGNWSSYSSEAETICTQTLQDAAPNVRARAGAVLAAYQGLPTGDRKRVLALVDLGARKAGNANEQRYWVFIKKTVESRSP
ncbi:MAG: hypothetical protein IT363_16015 [Methanoregulaceae archaeon]|nr:hypothetical protein [Methanoregulaceae archaeon]